MGFDSFGTHVLISDKASIYNPGRISLGSHVRIDDFCVLSAGEGGISIGSFVHIAVFSVVIGKGRITIKDYSGLSSRVSIYSSNDDYTGRFMTNPTVPVKFTNVKHLPVTLEKHVIVGSGSVILPGVRLNEGVAVGSLSLVKGDCEAFTVYAGNPAEPIGRRRRSVLQLEVELRKQFQSVYPPDEASL